MEDTIIKALLLGYAHIECNGTPIRICLKKAQGLLFYLLVHKKATRDELTGLLWGGEDNELARRHLRDNLYHLKKVVPIELVVPAGRSAIQLNPELGFYIDVDEFLKAVDVEAYLHRIHVSSNCRRQIENSCLSPGTRTEHPHRSNKSLHRRFLNRIRC
jgi:DNA-binding SARP family transcriptional activator